MSTIAILGAGPIGAGIAQTLARRARVRDVLDEGRTGGGALITFAGWDAPPMWGVDYAVADARVALALLKMPAVDVRAVLGRDWARWTDPGTTSAALARALGVGGVRGFGTPAGASCP